MQEIAVVSEHVDGNDGYEGEDKKISEGCGLTALEIAEKPSDGEGNDKRPMGCHDMNLVKSEAQTHMQQQVEHEDGKEQLLKTLLASHKGADNKHYYYGSLNGILYLPRIFHYHRTTRQHIAQHMLAMELYRLAKKILYHHSGALEVVTRPLKLLAYSTG